MPLDFNRIAEFNIANFTPGVIPDIQGGVVCTPNNMIPDQYFRALQSDGAPVGWSKVEGPANGGYHAYLFEVGGAVRSGGKQTATPDTPEQDTHLFNTPLVSGGPAPTSGTPGVATPASPLEAPEVTKVATGVSGLPKGAYLSAISYEINGAHTMTTNPVPVTISTDGKLLEFKLLLDADRTMVTGQGLWLSAPVAIGQTPDPATMRLQDVAPPTGRTFVVKGPYKFTGRLAPTKNETMIGVPPKLERPRDGEPIGGQAHMVIQGRYVFYIVQSTIAGDSLPSDGEPPYPGYMTFRTWQKPGYGFQWHPVLLPQATGWRLFWQNFDESSNPGFYELVRTRGADRTRPFAPDEKPVFFGNIDDGEVLSQKPGTYTSGNVPFTVSQTTDILVTASSQGFGNGTEVRLSGLSGGAPLKSNTSYWVVNKSGNTFKLATKRGGTAINITSGGGGRVYTYKVVAAPGQYEYIGVESDPPDEDTSGIADPTGDADAPTPVGMGTPPAGKYLVGYTRVLGGQETPVSDMVEVDLSEAEVNSGIIIQMEYPPRVNKIPNALYGQVDNAGLPLNWTAKDSTDVTVTATGANTNFEKAGVFYVQTSGSLANTGRYPNMQTLANKEIAVDPARLETVAGWLEVSNYTSGNAYVELVQLNAARAEVGTRLTLATLNANGAIYFEKTVATASLAPNLSLHGSCSYVRIQWGAEGNPRLLRVKAHSLIWAPQEGVSRRYVAPTSPSEYWQATNDPATPWPSTHILAIGQPPPTSASVAADVVAPPPPTPPEQVELVNYDNLAAGAEPSGWTEVTANGGTAGAFASTVWGNVNTYRVVGPNNSAQNQAYMKKAFTWSAPTAVFIFRVRVTSVTANGGVNPFGVWPTQYTSGTPIGNPGQPPVGVTLYPGALDTDTYDAFFDFPTGSDFYRLPYTKNQNIEFKVTFEGLNTDNGTLTYHHRLQGSSTWIQASQREGLRWVDDGYSTSFLITQGVTNEYFAMSWTIDYGQLYIGTADVGGGTAPPPVNTAPSLTPLTQPDWPWLAGTTLNGPSSSPVDYTYTTSNNASLAVAATFNRASAVGAERTLAQIRSSAGTEVVGLYMKTDHTVELRRGGTFYPVSAAVPTSTNYRFDVIVAGAGTVTGVVLVYRTIGTGTRELIVLGPNVNLTGLQAQRATVANNTELTETNIVVTSSGEFTYDNVGHDNLPVNQGYVSLIAADVTNKNVGFVVDEYIVKPGQERTFAVYMKPDDLNVGAAPFTVVAYDQIGQSVELGSAYANGTAVANLAPGWFEYWMTYTAPEGYYRIRVETRNFTSGRYVFQKPLDALGNLSTVAARNALRDDRRSVGGTYTVALNSRIPQTSQTMMSNAYGERRTSLGYQIETPDGARQAFTAALSTDLLTVAGHRYQTSSAVRVEGLTNAAPLAADTTYFVRDISGNTFKLAATPGGAAINITSDGSGTIYGYTYSTARYYSTDNPEVVGTWFTEGNEALVPDLEWVYAELTLYGDGIVTPRVPLGSPYVSYTTNMPVLLRADRSALPGGVYIGGGDYANNLGRPFSRSLFDEEGVGDRALARALTGKIGRLWGYTLNIFHPDALDEIQSDSFVEDDWVIESPYHDMVLRVRHYGVPGEPAAMFDYEGFDERKPFAISQMMPLVIAVERAEVVQLALLAGVNDSLLIGGA